MFSFLQVSQIQTSRTHRKVTAILRRNPLNFIHNFVDEEVIFINEFFFKKYFRIFVVDSGELTVDVTQESVYTAKTMMSCRTASIGN